MTEPPTSAPKQLRTHTLIEFMAMQRDPAWQQDQLFDVVNDRLKQIPGVRATESFVYFDIHTHRFDWDVPE